MKGQQYVMAGVAKFREAAFFVETTERAGGRRTVRHDYPFRDAPFFEDLGRAVRTIPVEGHVVGPDYAAARDSLIAALEAPGPGRLDHPWYGPRTVVCTSFRVREASAEAGIVRFSMEFEESEPTPLPMITPAALEAVSASTETFVNCLNLRAARWAPKDYRYPTLLDSSIAAVKAASAALTAAMSPVVKGIQAAAAFKAATNLLISSVDSLVRKPLDVLGSAIAVVDSLTDIPPLPGVRAWLRAFGFSPGVRPPATTPARVQEGDLFDLIGWLFRALFAAQAALAAAQAADAGAFDSYDAAVATRDGVCDAVEALLDDADDDSFAALEQVRADLVRAVPGEASDLPRLVRYQPPITLPSLVLAQRLYGDATMEADLVARNGVNRPGFVPGGIPLEVLSRAS